MSFKRGTTPVNEFLVDVDLTGASVYITYKQKDSLILERHDGITVTSTSLSITLTQDETLAFKPGDVEVQIRAVYPNGVAIASDIINTRAERILKEGVIS